MSEIHHPTQPPIVWDGEHPVVRDLRREISIYLQPSLIRVIDLHRGKQPRSAWIERAIRAYIDAGE